jgi:hypothetical protein
MWYFPNFYTSISKNCSECKMQFMSSGFNNIEGEWFNLRAIVNNSRDAKKFSTHSSINVKHYVVMCVSIYTNKCNMWHLDNGFNKLKMHDSTHAKMLIVKEMWKSH